MAQKTGTINKLCKFHVQGVKKPILAPIFSLVKHWIGFWNLRKPTDRVESVVVVLLIFVVCKKGKNG